MKKTAVAKIHGREVLDSRGNPTVEAEVTLEDGTTAVGQSPSGASTGMYEACELRDGDSSRYLGKGVLGAVENINAKIAPVLTGSDASDIYGVDRIMTALDPSRDKSTLGANAMLAVSFACAEASAKSMGIPLYRFIGGVSAQRMPVPMMNILNGGAHSSNGLDVQEFMIMPVGARCFSEGLRHSSEVYHTLGKILKNKGLSTAVGDEGGFAPEISSDIEALDLIVEAIRSAGFEPERDFTLALDAATSEWKSGEKGVYLLPKSGAKFDSRQLVDYWESLCGQYPIRSLEDGLDEEDWSGWRMLTSRLGSRISLVGDDLFVTNTSRLEQGIHEGAGNAILIKPNQIGTLSETISAVEMAKRHGYSPILSHRSGETESSFIADLAVGLNVRRIKTGAPCRSERTAKYNRLLRIEEQLYPTIWESYGDCL